VLSSTTTKPNLSDVAERVAEAMRLLAEHAAGGREFGAIVYAEYREYLHYELLAAWCAYRNNSAALARLTAILDEAESLNVRTEAALRRYGP
jgi:hypothetical protein